MCPNAELKHNEAFDLSDLTPQRYMNMQVESSIVTF